MKTKDKLKLNHPCTFCKKEIYIGEGTIIEGELKHFKCYKNQIEQKMKKEFLEIIDEIISEEWNDVCKANKDNGVIYAFKQNIKRKLKSRIMGGNKEKQVEELEKEIDNINNIIQDSQGTYDPKDIIRGIEEKAKLLKAEIEKGCEKDLKRKAFDGNISLYCGIEIFVNEKLGLKNIFCPTCQNLIQRLNKIIGGKDE